MAELEEFIGGNTDRQFWLLKATHDGRRAQEEGFNRIHGKSQ